MEARSKRVRDSVRRKNQLTHQARSTVNLTLPSEGAKIQKLGSFSSQRRGRRIWRWVSKIATERPTLIGGRASPKRTTAILAAEDQTREHTGEQLADEPAPKSFLNSYSPATASTDFGPNTDFAGKDGRPSVDVRRPKRIPARAHARLLTSAHGNSPGLMARPSRVADDGNRSHCCASRTRAGSRPAAAWLPRPETGSFSLRMQSSVWTALVVGLRSETFRWIRLT
jgi:hypothetical protein